MRYARLEFYPGGKAPVALTPQEVNVEVVRLDPAMDAIVGPNPKIFKLAEGFKFTEGPIWVNDGGYLLFSDPNSNVIWKYTPDGHLEVFRSQWLLRRRVRPAWLQRLTSTRRSATINEAR
jgi:gluconolactonase